MEKSIYRAAVSQRLRNIGIEVKKEEDREL
jgi:hypothetical protein